MIGLEDSFELLPVADLCRHENWPKLLHTFLALQLETNSEST